MAEFKPMVKMFTDEPSVILKLKKGGKVKGNTKAKMASSSAEGFKSMASNSKKLFEAAPEGVAPKKPSIAARMKAMNPNMYAKGGKVVHKQMGGMMPGAAGAGALGGMAPMGTGAAMAPMNRAALAGMAPGARMKRAAAVRRALTGMKKGGSTSAECAKLEKELKHHEALSMNKAHPMKKASGGAIDAADTKTTLKNSVKPFAKTKMVTSKRDTAHGTGEVKEGKPGGYAMGGSIMGNEGPFENTKMVSAGKGKTNGTTGGVRMGNAGGFKKGGKAMLMKASGGTIDKKMTRTTVEGGNWENRPANTSKPGKTNTKTGEVKEANAGGYKKGGRAKKYERGGNVSEDREAFDRDIKYAKDKLYMKPGEDSVYSRERGLGPGLAARRLEERGVDIKGLVGNRPSEIGEKKGGRVPKKAFATGGQVVDDGKAVKMPRHFVSRPVANSLQSGTFKKGGKVEKEEKPNLRLVKTHTGPKGHVAKVYKDRDWDEHRVKFFSPEGKHLASADYHTDDVSDAHDTAMSQVNKGYKRGGKAKMADGGSTKNASLWTKINPTLKDKYMRVNEPVNPNYSETAVDKAIASSNRSGRKISGKEAKSIHSLLKGRYADGGKVPAEIADKLKTAENERAYKNWEKSEEEENKAMRESILGAPRRAYEAVKGMFGSSDKAPPAGSVTKTEKSVTVAPAKKRGGLAKC
jgi:hypothetical protein